MRLPCLSEREYLTTANQRPQLIPPAYARQPSPGATLLQGAPRSERLRSSGQVPERPPTAYLLERRLELCAGTSAAVQLAGDGSVALHRRVGAPKKATHEQSAYARRIQPWMGLLRRLCKLCSES
jgi:hypothetical protein